MNYRIANEIEVELGIYYTNPLKMDFRPIFVLHLKLNSFLNQKTNRIIPLKVHPSLQPTPFILDAFPTLLCILYVDIIITVERI